MRVRYQGGYLRLGQRKKGPDRWEFLWRDFGSGPSNGHGPPFLQGHQTTGASSLAADNGFSAGLDLSPVRAFDFTVAYSRSTHYDLNTVSFDIAVNMRAILRHPGL